MPKLLPRRNVHSSSFWNVARNVCAILLSAALVVVSLWQGGSNFRRLSPHEKMKFVRRKQDAFNKIEENKTLVIVMGSLRGGEFAWHSLYENLLDPNLADLALAVGYVPDAEKNSSLYSRAKYLWEFEEYNDWGIALDMIAGEHDPTYEKYANTSWRAILVEGMPSVIGGSCGIAGSGALVFWQRWFVYNKIAELKLLKKYDRFVVTRSDHYYLCEHNLTALEPTKVWVPEGEEWGGITDRHVVAPAEKILQVLDILPPLLRHPSEFIKFLGDMYHETNTTNAEKLLLRRWHMQGIIADKFPRMMFTCAVLGDRTRWWGPSPRLGPHGVNLKYEGEYDQSKVTCGVP
jgi:hypothetical protein